MLKPLHDYVLLKKIKEENMTASGIFLSTTKEESKFVLVVDKGDEVKSNAYDIGDRVLIKEYEGTIVDDYILIKDEYIIGVDK